MDHQVTDQIIYSILLSRQVKTRPLRSYITLTHIRQLLDQIEIVLKKEPILLEIPADIIVVGDIHGNIDDLIRIFDRCGYPPDRRYLFLGDYVDRGKHSVEVVLMLFALKIKYPEHIYLIRGNHEITRISEFYGLLDEVEIKYTASLFYSIHAVFSQLPIAAVILDSIICVHGGIGPSFKSVIEFKQMEKPDDIDGPSVFQDIVWSDPREDVTTYEPSPRGCGFYFGRNALQKFLTDNQLDLMIRSHELCDDGINQPIMSKDGKSPLCLTIFSNTDYCGRKNKACVCNITEDLIINIETFEPLTPNERSRININFPNWLLYLIEDELNSPTIDSEPNSEVEIHHEMNLTSSILLCE